jgi:HK97 family phage major capsid protein
MEALQRAGDLSDWAHTSAGMLPMATPGVATVVGMRESGATTLTEERDAKGRKSILVSEEGEILMDAAKYKAISSPDYAREFRQYMRLGEHALKTGAFKVLQEGIDTSGGFTVPEDMLNRLIAKEPAPTNLAGKVSILNTSRDSMTMPRVVYTTDNIYTTGMRVTWTGEIPAAATQHRVTEPSFGQIRIPIFTAMMSLPLTVDMVDDSATDIVGWATSKFSETADLLYDNMIVNGAGVTQPDGILINAQFISNDVHTGVADALSWDGILDLLYSLPEQYDRNALVVMNKTNCARALAKLQDGQGRPYWTIGSQDWGLAGGRINRPLEGYPVMFNSFMPNVSAGLYPIVFGDLSGYYLVRRIGFSIQVLRELYAETNQILLLGRVRFGGQLVEDWRLRGQVVSA